MKKIGFGIKLAGFLLFWMNYLAGVAIILWLLSLIISIIKFNWLFIIIISGICAFLKAIEIDEKYKAEELNLKNDPPWRWLYTNAKKDEKD